MSEEDIEYLDMIRPRSYILHPHNKFLVKFEYAVILAAIYQGVYVPFALFFIETTPPHFGGLNEGYKLWHNLHITQEVAEVVFYCDLIMGFFTAYFDRGIGEYVWNPRKIAKHYLLSHFPINLLATLHWSFIFQKVFGLVPHSKTTA